MDCVITYLLLERDPAIKKPGKRMLSSRFWSDDFVFMSFRRWEPLGVSEKSDWLETYRLNRNKGRKTLTIVDGALSSEVLAYAWEFQSSRVFGMTMSEEKMSKFLKKYGLKATSFGSVKLMNDHCISLGYPRIGDFLFAPAYENFIEATSSDPRRRIFEKYEFNPYTRVAVSLTEF